MKKLVLTLVLGASAASARPVDLPYGDPDRAGIMDAIREGTGSDAVFKVDFIRIDRSAKPRQATNPVPLAYVEVRPADARSPGFRGWALLRLWSAPQGHIWRLVVAMDERELSDCDSVTAAALAVWSFVSESSSPSLLGPKALARRSVRSARKEANGQDIPWTGVCAGRVLRP